jgi:hypothetical protein
MALLSAADPALLFWILAIVHVAGVVSTLMARLPRLHHGHRVCHHGFVACLVFVGLATLGTILMQSHWWVWSGTTFSLMAVGATTDLGRRPESGLSGPPNSRHDAQSTIFR